MKKVISHLVSGILGLYLAVRFVPGIEFKDDFSIILIFGALLGLVNCFIKPVIKIVSLPIRIMTLGLFSLAINIILVWFVIDIFSPIEIKGFIPLLLTTIIIWLSSLIIKVFIHD